MRAVRTLTLNLLFVASSGLLLSACSKPEDAKAQVDKPAAAAPSGAATAVVAMRADGWLDGAWQTGAKRRWQGTWDDSGGYVSSFVVDLDRTATGVLGVFTWTMLKVPTGSPLATDVGVPGHEWVVGTFDDMTGALDLKGTKVDQPKWLEPGTYGVVVSRDGSIKGAETRDGAEKGKMTGKPQAS